MGRSELEQAARALHGKALAAPLFITGHSNPVQLDVSSDAFRTPMQLFYPLPVSLFHIMSSTLILFLQLKKTYFCFIYVNFSIFQFRTLARSL